MHRRLRNAAYLAASIALATGAAVATSQTAQAATIDTTAWYQLVNRNSSKALDVEQASTADGAEVVQWTTSASAENQQWQFVSSGGGYYRLRARHSGKALDVEANSTADGANVVQWTDNNATNQQWSVADTTSGYVKLLNRRSGKALDVEARSTADGGNVIQWTDTGGTNQQWQLVRVGSAPPTTPNQPTKPLTIPGNLGTHDPSRIINDNGSYYFYSTSGNLSGWYTTDGQNWRATPAIFPNGLPDPIRNTVPVNNGVWAPDVIWNPNTGLFDMYYSIANWDDARQSAIGLVTSPTLNPNASNYRWTDRGVVISWSTANGSTIDPAPFFDTSGNLWLAYGSGYGSVNRDRAINIIALDKSTGLRRDGNVYNQLSCGCEASYVLHHGSYYYLFWNTGGCCSGASSTYTVHIARSTSVTGPYTERSNHFISSTSTRHGPGHIGVLSENGKDYYTYHYYPNSGGSVLGLGTITWGSDGWPTS